MQIDFWNLSFVESIANEQWCLQPWPWIWYDLGPDQSDHGIESHWGHLLGLEFEGLDGDF